MLDSLLREFGDLWFKILVLVGVSFSDIEAELSLGANINLTKKRVSA